MTVVNFLLCCCPSKKPAKSWIVSRSDNLNQVTTPHVQPPKDSHVPKLAVSSMVHALMPKPGRPGYPGTACCVLVVVWRMLHGKLKSCSFPLASQRPHKSNSMSHACFLTFTYPVGGFYLFFFFFF